jgi:GT2 family glycosyltransferase
LNELSTGLPAPALIKALGVARRVWKLLPLPIRRRMHRGVTMGIGRIVPGFFLEAVELEREYQTWIARHDTLTEADVQAIRAHIARLAEPPKISVVMPVFNPAPDHLRSAIGSVRTQLYPNWELCIADDASTDPEVIAVLAQSAAVDGRIRLARRDVNGHISAASNTALDLATGAFVALLDHDDVLAPRALYEVAVELTEHPETDVIYSDEDHIDDDAVRSSPYFKVGWNPDLMLGQNLINHLGVYRLDLLRRIGGFREGFEGSQDYDLALRAVAACSADRIRHIPAVLYHWRRTSAAGSFSEESMERCVRNAHRAIRDHLRTLGVTAQVEPAPSLPHWTRVVRPVPDPAPLVSVIIPTRDRAGLLRRCLEGLSHRTDYPNLEILILDNDSTEARTFALFDEARNDPRIRILPFPGPFNYAAMNNHGVAEARGELVLLLNNDIEVIGSDWLSDMVSHAVRPEIGAVGAKLLYRSGLVQHGGVLVGLGGVAGNQFLFMSDASPGYFGQLGLVRDILAVTGACLLVRKALYQAVGGLNADALPVSFNDVDLCLRIAERGFRNLWTPFAKLYHLESASRGDDVSKEERARAEREADWMRKRWGGLLRENPDFNPNLISSHPHYRLAFPPRRRKPWDAAGA